MMRAQREGLLTPGPVGPINVLNIVERHAGLERVAMEDLTKEQVTGLGRAVGLDIQDPELTEVTYNINALLQALDGINPPGLDAIEPLPIVLPSSD